jgi:glutamate N-acetyltransferase/amino-acid N-acetyltransferase
MTANDFKPVAGFQVAGVHCGLKKDGKLDFALIVSDKPCAAAGVFTTNRVKAAPVLVDMERLKQHAHHIRAIAVNTGCANACTGQQGIDNALQTARWVAEEIGCDENEVLVLSTGVIGTQLPMDKIRQGIRLAADSLGTDWEAAARAIMTTDTKPKLAQIWSKGITTCGIAKGAGMIAPNMATMLGVIATDAVIDPSKLYAALHNSVSHTFNCIIVDGDMSTNDTVLVLANGASDVRVLGKEESAGIDFYDAGTSTWENFHIDLGAVSRELATDIVRDGEGATKLITIRVTGAPDGYWDELRQQSAAHTIAYTIATSPLVKTAFYGNDANWGRIIAAAGRSGVPLDPEKMTLWISPGHDLSKDALTLFLNGMHTNYSEEEATRIMSQPSVFVHLHCGIGTNEATVWTCDLSHDYVSINGDYRS